MTASSDDPRIERGMRAQIALRRERMAAGDGAIGWKVGLGTQAAMQRLQIAGPLVGFLSESSRVSTGDTVSLRGWVKPTAEPELAIHIGRDLRGGSDEAAARAAIAAVGPAIELVDIDPPPEDVEAILAANIFHRRVILGAADPERAGGDVGDLTAVVRRNGEEVARVDDLEAATGNLIAIVRHVADTLERAGERLLAGQVIIAGSIIPAIALTADDRKVSYDVAGLGGLTVRFTAD